MAGGGAVCSCVLLRKRSVCATVGLSGAIANVSIRKQVRAVVAAVVSVAVAVAVAAAAAAAAAAADDAQRARSVTMCVESCGKETKFKRMSSTPSVAVSGAAAPPPAADARCPPSLPTLPRRCRTNTSKALWSGAALNTARVRSSCGWQVQSRIMSFNADGNRAALGSASKPHATQKPPNCSLYCSCPAVTHDWYGCCCCC